MQSRFTVKVLPLKTQVLDLYGEWMTQENFINEMPVKIRVMRDCIVITPQHTRELFGCIEGMSVTFINQKKVKAWLKTFPGGAERYRRYSGD
ncbi:SymE family type I addiction module toxin [Salmonella enterica]|uniref:SymE family type I addiction module toxin n=1 Tax=Salmonella enterica TaxID=28901 RepID=UPI0033149718